MTNLQFCSFFKYNLLRPLIIIKYSNLWTFNSLSIFVLPSYQLEARWSILKYKPNTKQSWKYSTIWQIYQFCFSWQTQSTTSLDQSYNPKCLTQTKCINQPSTNSKELCSRAYWIFDISFCLFCIKFLIIYRKNVSWWNPSMECIR